MMNFFKYNLSNYLRHPLLVLSFLFFACSSDDEITPVSGQFDNGVIIINEGNMTEADGSLSYYDQNTGQVQLKIFNEVNNRELSGVFQSLSFHDGIGYLINGSGSIEVFSEDSLKYITTIDGPFSIPRYMAAVDSKGYISDWGPYDANYNNPESYIVVVDLVSFEIIKTIDVPSRPEELIAYNGAIYIANSGSDKITVIHSETEGLDEIVVPEGPQAMEIDASGNIWVLCSSGVIVRINPETEQVEEIVTLEGDNPSGELEINKAKDQLYYLTSRYEPDFTTINNVYKIDINNLTANPEPIISKKNLYGLGVDPVTDIIYVADNHALQGNGTVIRFDADGNEIDNFAVGRNPNGFVFR